MILLLLPLFLTSCGPGRPHLKTLELNREGNKQLKAQTYNTAMEKYLEAMRFDPFVGELHLNLGLTFEGLQQAEKALQSYKAAEELALQAKNYPLVFMARFNQAQLLGKVQKVDEALALYQKALELIPTSNEVKTNIELLTQSQQGKGRGDGEGKQDPKDQQNKDDKGQGKDDKDKEKEDKPKQVQQSAKYKPRPFQGKELSEGDVKKILGELKQQEEKIRAEYNRKELKEQPRDKDW
jgi:tetratricopeptide (TPR) repeat protein